MADVLLTIAMIFFGLLFASTVIRMYVAHSRRMNQLLKFIAAENARAERRKARKKQLKVFRVDVEDV